MAFPALKILGGETTSAKDCIPITASSANNVFGKAYNVTNGGDARACRSLLADSAMTISFVSAVGILRSNVVIQAGVTQLQAIQVTAISAGNLWALI